MDDDMLDVVECWTDLETARSSDYLNDGKQIMRTYGPIPWPAIDRWATRKGLDGRAFRLLVDVIGYLDNKFADRQTNKVKG